MYKFLALLLVAGFAGLFFVKGPSGKPILTIEDLKPDLPDVDILTAEPISVYKWKDEYGVWQFSDAPVEAEQVEIIQLDGKINTIPAFKAPVAKDRTANKMQIPAIASGLTSASPEQLAEMMETINNLQETVDGRTDALNKIGQD